MREKKLARCRGDFTIVKVRGAYPTLGGHFEYENGRRQGFGGLVIDMDFVMRFLSAIGPSSFSDVNEKSC